MTPFVVLRSLGTLQQLRATVQGWSHRITLASAYSGVAFVFIIVGIGFFAAALFFGLARAMPAWAAALIVGVVLVVLAGLAALLARYALKRGRGGTGYRLAETGKGYDPLLAALQGVNTNTVYALAAGILGGLLATRLRSRVERRD